MKNLSMQEDINKKIEKDLKYIKNDIIAKQTDNDILDNDIQNSKYIKFSKIVDGVTVVNMTKSQYEKYWLSQYQENPNKIDKILKAISDKFQNGLTNKDDMLKLIVYSKDSNEEKISAIKCLIGEK